MISKIILNKKLFSVLGIILILSAFTAPLVINAISISPAGDSGLKNTTTSLDLQKIGEQGKNFLQRFFNWFDDLWNNKGLVWIKNIYYKIVAFLNGNIVIK